MRTSVGPYAACGASPGGHGNVSSPGAGPVPRSRSGCAPCGAKHATGACLQPDAPPCPDRPARPPCRSGLAGGTRACACGAVVPQPSCRRPRGAWRSRPRGRSPAENCIFLTPEVRNGRPGRRDRPGHGQSRFAAGPRAVLRFRGRAGSYRRTRRGIARARRRLAERSPGAACWRDLAACGWTGIEAAPWPWCASARAAPPGSGGSRISGWSRPSRRLPVSARRRPVRSSRNTARRRIWPCGRGRSWPSISNDRCPPRSGPGSGRDTGIASWRIRPTSSRFVARSRCHYDGDAAIGSSESCRRRLPGSTSPGQARTRHDIDISGSRAGPARGFAHA